MRSRKEFTEMVFERGRLREEQNHRRRMMIKRTFGAAAAAVVVAAGSAMFASKDGGKDMTIQPELDSITVIEGEDTTGSDAAQTEENAAENAQTGESQIEETTEYEVKVIPGKLDGDESDTSTKELSGENDDSIDFNELLRELGYSLDEEYEGDIRIIDSEGNEHLFETMEEVYEFLESDREYLFTITGDLRGRAGLEMRMSDNSPGEGD